MREPGTTYFVIDHHGGNRIEFRVSGADRDLVLQELQEHGYVVDEFPA